MDILERLFEKAEARKAYMREYMNKYYAEHKDTILAQQLRSNTENREKVRARYREWYARKRSGKKN